MSVSLKKAEETEVINFVYKLSQAVKRLQEGVEPTEGDLDLLLARLDRMETIAALMVDQYPDLPTTLDRMRLRLYVLMSNRRRSNASPSDL